MSSQPLSITLPHELAHTFIQKIQAELSADSGVQLRFQLVEPELCAMGRQLLPITLPHELAHTFIQKIQAVLDCEASYFHEELWADSARQLGFTCPDGVGGVL